MSFDAGSAAISARQNYLSTFRKHLKGSVFATLIVASACYGALAQDAKYFNADGTKTNDFEAARKTWQADAEFNGNWGLKAIGADAAYALGIAGEGVKLGVFDQPVWHLHPEFATQDGSVFPKLTFLTTSGIRTYTDPHIPSFHAGDPFKYDGTIYIDAYDDLASHGTHVAGIAAANRDGKGTQGTAYKASILAADDGDPGPEDGIVKGDNGGVYAAGWKALADSGAQIITNSWGIGVHGLKWEYPEAYAQYKEVQAIMGTPEGGAYDGVLYAASKGVVIEFSAGNDGNAAHPDTMAGLASFIPDIEKYWLTTASVELNPDDPAGVSISSFSSRCGYTKYFCVSAPGTQINSSVATGDATGKARGDWVPDDEVIAGYESWNGTSMAGPFASGSWALIKARFPYLAGGEVNEILKTTATDLGDPGVDDLYGWGLINIAAAMKGPGQFMTRFEANMPEGTNDTWSNNISQTALDQRQAEETADIATWTAKKTDKGWQNGIPEAQKLAIRDAVSEDLSDARLSAADSLVRARYRTRDAFYFSKGSEDDFLAADTAMRENPVALTLFNAFISTPYDGSAPREPQYAAFRRSLEGSFDTIREETIQTRIDADQNEFDGTEFRTATLAAKIASGSGYDAGLTKSGAGTLRLTGNSTYRGDTLVNGGLLGVDGSLTSRVLVNNTGTLSGNGRVGALVANSDGTVAPGNSIGTLTVTGDATFNPSSVFSIEVADAKADRLVVEGKATLLGGVVLLKPEGGPNALTPEQTVALLGQTYTILTAAGGVSGTFDEAQTGYVFIGASLAYDINSVSAALALNGVAFADLGKTRNQRATLAGIQSTGFGNPIFDTVVTAVNPETPSAIAAPLVDDVQATLSGVLVQDASFISTAATDRVRAAFDGVAAKPQPVTSPMAFGPEAKAKGGDAFATVTPAASTVALWGEAYGAFAHADSDGNASGFSRNIGGFVTGLDGVVAETWRLGVLAGYGNTSLDGRAAFASVDSYQIGLYGGTQWDAIGLRLGTAFSQNEIDTDRTAVFGGLANRHSASYDAQSVQVFGELGYEIKTAYADFEPFAGASYVHLKADGFRENGAISNLTGLSGSTDLTTTTLGLRASHDFALSETIVLTARGMAGWSHVYGDVTPQQRLAFSGGQAFTIEGLPLAQDAGIVEAGFDLGIGQSTTVGLSYTGQFSSQASDNAVRADLTVRF